MAAKMPKRIWTRRPGLAQAAMELGVTLSHLRRVVIGERKTPLLARYQALNSATQTTKPDKRP